jgi:DNA polymerase III epsilon subunit-like protein
MSLVKCKVSYEPFTSIDIETTGLDPVYDSILEVGAAFYNGVDRTPETTISFLVIPEGATEDPNFRISGQPVALVMNAAILTEMNEAIREHLKNKSEGPLRTKTGQLILEEYEAMDYLYQWLDHLMVTKDLKKKHIFAGKNLHSLDLPFIREKMGDRRIEAVRGYRSLDLTSMFAPFSKKTSGLNDINKLRGVPQVSHRALEDAVQTADAILDIYEKDLQW